MSKTHATCRTAAGPFCYLRVSSVLFSVVINSRLIKPPQLLDGIVELTRQRFSSFNRLEGFIGQVISDRDIKAGAETGLGFTNEKRHAQ